MKKIISLLTAFLFFFVSTQAQQLFTLSFTGTGACPTQNNAGLQLTNASVTPLVRNGNGLACTMANDAFNSSGWTSGTTIDGNQYIEFSVSANVNFILKLTQISFSVIKSSSGPSNGRIAHDGGNGSFVYTNDFGVTTSSNTVTWDFADFSSPAGGTVRFRLYGWNGSASGTMRFSNITVTGTVAASPLVIDYSSGNVGISTTAAPSQKLEVNGNILASGKVMIGAVSTTNMANYSLAVNGTAIVNKLIVKKNTSTPWPDYVFGDNYKPISLDSLASFIKANRHLPEMTSAEEVDNNGVDVSITQSALLKKIEELTLYIIAQNKELAEQRKEQQAQAKQVSELTQAVTTLKASMSQGKAKSQ